MYERYIVEMSKPLTVGNGTNGGKVNSSVNFPIKFRLNKMKKY